MEQRVISIVGPYAYRQSKKTSYNIKSGKAKNRIPNNNNKNNGSKMGFQFIHMESYARVAGKGKEGGHDIRDIIDEVKRAPGAVSHIENPQTPKVLFGMDPEDVYTESVTWAEQAKDAKGRKLRKDGLCLLAGVISCPDHESQKWDRYKVASVKWLKRKYGDRLKSVVEHTDEAHKHLHFYVVPNAGERFETIHEGQKAANEAKAQGKVKGEQNSAYKKAMSMLQDQFYLQLASYFGFTRFGPKRSRMTRKEWKQKQHDAELLAQVKERVKKAENEGYEIGLNRGVAEASKIGAKTGAFLSGVWTKGVLGSWHAPTAKAQQEAENQKAHAKRYRSERNAARQAVETAEQRARIKVEDELSALREENEKKDRIIASQKEDLEKYEGELNFYRPKNSRGWENTTKNGI